MYIKNNINIYIYIKNNKRITDMTNFTPSVQSLDSEIIHWTCSLDYMSFCWCFCDCVDDGDVDFDNDDDNVDDDDVDDVVCQSWAIILACTNIKIKTLNQMIDTTKNQFF